ncbi:hypothetical protein MAM1_0410d10381 [Mucor ambiguus]|uniref:Reverse transcriptase domain-containing protein n=1 Tax=Mucor ambiguus TaxID=91626 RepID=A0A0C9MJ16_9FUNG|nr:hypothetical protein MAM1_0410d10381 [Mucor ambiguus]
MGNYRPLSLANCDYKCFTKILNQQMMIVSPKLINAHLIGFIPGKYIAENGLRCQLLMEDAELRWTLARQQGTTSTLDRDIGLLVESLECCLSSGTQERSDHDLQLPLSCR